MNAGTLNKTETPATGVIKHTRLNYCQEEKDYVSGGVTFNYPANTFTSAPNVRLGIVLKNLVYATDQIIVPIITSNTLSSTTIRINVGDIGGGIAEAATNDITIHLFASM